MPDAIYIAARRGLLDTLDAGVDQLDAIVLVGAQAVYLHTGDADLAVDPYTADADLALDPRELHAQPRLEELMADAGFTAAPSEVGRWAKAVEHEGQKYNVIVDLMVPEALAGGGRRSARIPPHAERSARRARGLEAALIDRERRTISSMSADDPRTFEIQVAGPSALLVAKLVKISERQDNPGRLIDKDALDVVRLLRAIPTEKLAQSLERLRRDALSAEVTAAAIEALRDLFGSPVGSGSAMAARAAAPLEREVTLAASAAALANDLLNSLGSVRGIRG